jgi:hypothetical protein
MLFPRYQCILLAVTYQLLFLNLFRSSSSCAGNPDNEPVLSRYPTCPPALLQRMLREQTFTAPVAPHPINSSASASDRAIVPSSDITVPSNAVAASKAPSTVSTTAPDSSDLIPRTGGGQGSFPLKLQRILDKLEAEGNHEIISWLPHGRAFAVHDPDRFVSDLMTVYFK